MDKKNNSKKNDINRLNEQSRIIHARRVPNPDTILQTI